jgi:class 3 adenylate cyclase
VTDDARPGAGPAAYRGFLFSDMRGFTAFAERHGNSAAAAAVSRFLDLARKAIARHDGTEVNTEGDAIHAVFPSASSAVMCGLEIVDAAAELNEREPDRPLSLGVGVHAGEAVETAGGYIGRAVNIAARLCAEARGGEVLVSSTVKGVAQASIPVGFIPRGKRRFKGIQDPILVYAVTRDQNVRPPREMPRPLLYGGVVLALAVIVTLAAFMGSQLLGGPGGSFVPGTPQPVRIGSLGIGPYTTTAFQPPFSFRIADQGWAANRDTPNVFGLIREVDPPGSVYVVRVLDVMDSPCLSGGEPTATGRPLTDVLGPLAALDQYVTLTAPEEVPVGALKGLQVEVSIDTGALAACGGLTGSQVSLFDTGEEVWSADPGERFRLISVTADGQPVTILVSSDWSRTPSVPQVEDLYAHAQRVLDTVELAPVPVPTNPG